MTTPSPSAPPPPTTAPQSPSSASLDSAGRPSQREFLILCLLLALTFGLLLARISGASALGSANDRSRWCTVWSLAEQNSFIIDDIMQRPGWDSIDKVRHEGHFYSTKPPLYPVMIAGLYKAIKGVTGLNLLTQTDLVARIILVIVNLIPFLIALYFWWRMLIRLEFSPTVRLISVALIGLTMPFLPYLMVLNNHTPGVTCLMLSLSAAAAIVYRRPAAWPEEAADAPAWLYAVCGFFAAFTCCHELPAALFGLMMFSLLLRHDWKKTAFYFVPVAIIPIAAFIVTNYIATGGWKPFYMYYGTEKYVYEYRGIPSYWSHPQGIDQARDSVPEYILHCLIGHHGIFSLTPLFLLSLPGLYLGLRRRKDPLWLFYAMGIVLTGAILLFYWKRTENYNYGGVSVALRWVLWLIPFWMLAVAEYLQRLNRLPRATLWLILLGVPSLFSAWGPWQTPWQQPWLFNLMSAQGWIDYSTPVEPLARPVSTWLQSLSDAPEADPLYWSEFRDARYATLRVSDGGPLTQEGRSARQVRAEFRDQDGKVTREVSWTIDLTSWSAGETPETFLLDWSDSHETATRTTQLHFLTGLPANITYRPGRFRYLFTPLREDAFRCRQLSMRALTKATETRPIREYRSDLWICEDLPFGVAQWTFTLTEYPENLLTERSVWTVSAVGTQNAAPPANAE